METIKHENVKFMPELPRSEPVIRDHTLDIKRQTCLRLYFYTAVLGYRERGNTVYLNWGIVYHKFRETLERTGDLKSALRVVLELWPKLGGDPTVGTKWDFMTLERLLASCKASYQHWLRERGQKRIEVLPEFIEKHLVVTLKDGITQIGARVDQLVRWTGRLWGRDFKTTSKLGKFYERTLDPNDQFDRQSFIESKLTGEHVEGILVEVLYNTKKEGPEVKGFLTQRTREQLQTFEDDQCYATEQLADLRKRDQWPMNKKHCPFCAFRVVCKAPNERSAVAQLKNNFDHKPWDFLREGTEDADGNSDSAVT